MKDKREFKVKYIKDNVEIVKYFWFSPYKTMKEILDYYKVDYEIINKRRNYEEN